MKNNTCKRIGDVSKQYNISIDNIYYYINFGLLVPPKPKGQYQFDTATLKDLELTLDLRSLDFTLKEIHSILSLYRVSNLAHNKDIEDLTKIYNEKKQYYKKKIDYYKQSTMAIDRKINELQYLLPKTSIDTGVPISMIGLLTCPVCNGDLKLTNVNMGQRYIYDGELECTCGYKAVIKNGILCTNNVNQSPYDKPDTERELYKDIPPSLISLFQKSYNDMVDKLNTMQPKNKVIMETYVNAWFFIHNHVDYLNNSNKFIIVDKFPETLAMYKTLFEEQGYELDILYLADSSTDYPLKPGIVDMHIDFFAVNEHNFFNHTFLLDELDKYLADDGTIIGTYFYFDEGYRSIKQLLTEYPESYQLNFNKEYFLSSLNHKYNIVDCKDVGYTVSSGSNLGFSFHLEDEKMHLMTYLAIKNS